MEATIVTRPPSWKYSVALRRGRPVRAPRDSNSAAASGPVVLSRPALSFSSSGSSFQATLIENQAPNFVAERRAIAKYRRLRCFSGST
ncbi:MAG TPA: hypothetical protein VH081_00975 [Solirubrobacteraceae bacterium]|nr:hypothetical protein [Solirubrobacteraceae bacterium]